MIIIAGCAVLDKDRVLMVQQGKGVIKELWSFPSGRLEKNEKYSMLQLEKLKKKQGIRF